MEPEIPMLFRISFIKIDIKNGSSHTLVIQRKIQRFMHILNLKIVKNLSHSKILIITLHLNSMFIQVKTPTIQDLMENLVMLISTQEKEVSRLEMISLMIMTDMDLQKVEKLFLSQLIQPNQKLFLNQINKFSQVLLVLIHQRLINKLFQMIKIQLNMVMDIG